VCEQLTDYYGHGVEEPTERFDLSGQTIEIVKVTFDLEAYEERSDTDEIDPCRPDRQLIANKGLGLGRSQQPGPDSTSNRALADPHVAVQSHD
jgi:hypothetical protein